MANKYKNKQTLDCDIDLIWIYIPITNKKMDSFVGN